MKTKELTEVKFLHLRNYTDDGVPSEMGGLTVAFTPALDGEKDTLWVGLSKCSDQDNFCKRIGRLISQGRLQCGPRNDGRGAHIIKTSEQEIHSLCRELTNWAIKEVYGN